MLKICEVYVSLTSNTRMPREIHPWDRYCLIDVQVQPRACYLVPGPDSKTKQRSFIDDQSGLIVSYVATKVPGVSFSAVLAVNSLNGKQGKSKGAITKVTINIYGPKAVMGEVDQALSEISANLQHPVFLEPDVVYINPQFFYPTAEKTDLRHLVGPVLEDAKSDTSRAIDGVMESLGDWLEDTSAMRCPQRYLRSTLDTYLARTTLKEYLPSAIV